MADAKAPATYEAPKELPLQAQTQKFAGRAKRTPEDQAEFFYSLRGMHILFFVSSLIMLLSLVWTMIQDWDRPWKKYQYAFKSMELARVEHEIQSATHVKGMTEPERRRLDAEISKMEPDPAKPLEGPIADWTLVRALAWFDGEIARIAAMARTPELDRRREELEKESAKVAAQTARGDKTRTLKALQEAKEKLAGDHQLKMQIMNFVNSDYMTFRYRHDEAHEQLVRAHEEKSPRVEAYEQIYEREKRNFERILEERQKSKAAFDQVDTEMGSLDDSIVAVTKPLTLLKDARTALDKAVIAGMRRVRSEKPQPGNTVRDLPGLDFFDPSVRVVQVIVTDSQQDIHFAKVDRVDRCHTCHQGIGNPNYSAATEKHEGHESLVFKDEYLAAFVKHAAGTCEETTCVVCKQKREPLVDDKGATSATHVPKRGEWGKERADEYTRALAAHPRLDLYVGGASPHPIARFGCTSCHGGDGRETEFNTAVHFPNDEEQEHHWKNRLGYVYRELWDEPMLPKKHVYASCRKCHTSAVDLEDGGDYVAGQKLYERLGCYACHRTDSYQILPKNLDEMDKSGETNRKYRRPGPPLTHIADKVDENWMYKWVLAPKDYRHTTRMPHFFGQSNSRSVKVGNKVYDPTQVESTIVASLTKYIMSTSQTRSYPELPPTPFPADPKRGELLFEQVGCRACHTTQPDELYPERRDIRNEDDRYRAAEDDVLTKAEKESETQRKAKEKEKYVPKEITPGRNSHYQKEFAPNLSAMGSKVNAKWLFAWLKNPKHYFEQTRMGSFRLSDQEAADVSAFLLSMKKSSFDAKPGMPATDDALLNQLIFEQLRAKMPDVDADAETKRMGLMADGKTVDLETKQLWFGRKMVMNYGCFSCHELKSEVVPEMKGQDYVAWTDRTGKGRRLPGTTPVDWTNQEGIGVEMTGAQPWGVKGVDRLAFNFAEYEPPNYTGVAFKHPITKKDYVQVGTPKPETVVRVHKLRHTFLANKLLNPRLFDGGKESSTPPDELLKMPNFYLTTEETQLLSTFVLSFLDAEVAGLVEKIKKRPSPDEVALARGQRLVRESNCRGCHRLEMDRYKVEWKRMEKQPDGSEKEITSNPWIEGRLRRELSHDEVKKLAVEWKLGEGARVFEFNWTSDGCTMEMPKVLGGGGSIVFDGRDWWYRDGAKQMPVIVHREQNGGDILEQIRLFKKKTGTDYWFTDESPTYESRYPPYLRTQGVKTQTEWFYAFLKSPYAIRPNLAPTLPDYPDKPSDEVRKQVKELVAKLWDPDDEEEEVLKPLRALGGPGLAAAKEEFLGATNVVIRWRLMLLMGVAGHPDISVRMPTFGFSDEEATSIAKYFWVRDQLKGKDVYPHTAFPERDPETLVKRQDLIGTAAKTVVAKDCVTCHLYDGKAPKLDDPKGSNKIAPDFTQMENRLRPRWLYAWLKNPANVYPGTTMLLYQYDPPELLSATAEFILNFQKFKGLKNK